MVRRNASSKMVNLMAPGSEIFVLGMGSNDNIDKLLSFFEDLPLCS